MECGLTYLAGENTGLLVSSANTNVSYINSEAWCCRQKFDFGFGRVCVGKTDGSELTLLILPLKKTTIDGTANSQVEGQVFIQQAYWPDFGGKESALQLNNVTWVQTQHLPLTIY